MLLADASMPIGAIAVICLIAFLAAVAAIIYLGAQRDFYGTIDSPAQSESQSATRPASPAISFPDRISPVKENELTIVNQYQAVLLKTMSGFMPSDKTLKTATLERYELGCWLIELSGDIQSSGVSLSDGVCYLGLDAGPKGVMITASAIEPGGEPIHILSRSVSQGRQGLTLSVNPREKVAYVVAWHYGGGAGFDWYYTAEAADIAYEEEKSNCHKFADNDWEAYRFDYPYSARHSNDDVTREIDMQLDDLCLAAREKYKAVRAAPLPSENFN